MKTPNLETDATVLTLTYPVGDYNSEMEIRAVKDGLMIDEYNVIPWVWIEAMREKIFSVKSPAQHRK
jgi:hypothetical protein